MGKVRIDTVKRIAKELMERYPDKFTTDYEENKKILAQYADSRTKKLRNRIAGYVTSLKKVAVRSQAAETAPAETPEKA